MRIKLAQPGFENYTGPIGAVMFKNGVSEDHVSKIEADRIGSALQIETIDGEPVSPAVDILKSMNARAPVQEPLPRGTDEENKPTATEALAVEHTKESLGAIADKHGINGLREIAAPLGVKGRAIGELIDAILKRQAELKAAAAQPAE